MANWSDKLLLGVLVVVGAPIVLGLAVVFSPVILYSWVEGYFEEKEDQRRYANYLQRLDGTCFFCYNNRKTSIDFARQQVVPQLDPAIQVIFVEGRKIKNVPEVRFVSHMLYQVKNRQGFPYLLKIKDGQVLDCSLNNQFFGIMHNQKPVAPLLERIAAFCQA